MNALDPENEKARLAERANSEFEACEKFRQNTAEVKTLIKLLTLKIRHDTAKALSGKVQ